MKETVNATAPTGQRADTLERQGQNRTWKTAMHAGFIQKDTQVARISAHIMHHANDGALDAN